MAIHYAIKVRFDNAVPRERIQELGARLKSLDYDFPVACLERPTYCDYRAPTPDDEEFVALFLQAGVSGSYWLVEGVDPDEAHDTDANCFVFRPGWSILQLQEGHLTLVEQALLDQAACVYLCAARTSGQPVYPIQWAVLDDVGLRVSPSSRASFENRVLLSLAG
mgnify:CR=1 FL=1